jgi:hypothetical protein
VTGRLSWLSLCLVLGAGRAFAEENIGALEADRPEVVESVYAKGALSPGWADLGWSPRLASDGPARMDLSDKGGWILAKRGAMGVYGGLVFQMKAPASFGDFLEVRLDAGRPTAFPRVKIDAAKKTPLEGGWVQVFLTMDVLNPAGISFDRVVFQAASSVGHEAVEFDGIGLTRALGLPARQTAKVKSSGSSARQVKLVVDCGRRTGSISPLIYGIAQSARSVPSDSASEAWSELRPTARRWSGSESSRYNWEAHVANAGEPDFFRNFRLGSPEAPAWRTFLQKNRDAGLMSAVTLSLLGWMAKDERAYGFPVSTFGVQAKTAPHSADVGNGVGPKGPLTPGPPEQTSVVSTPENFSRWVAAMRAEGGRRTYFLGHEPGFGHEVHRDIHPSPVSAAEWVDLTAKLASIVRAADPEAELASAAFSGWPEVSTLLPEALRGLKAAEAKAGNPLLDTVTVHWFPQGKGLSTGPEARTDAQTAALRIRSTRSLWDALYRDESWIGEPVRLLPRVRNTVAAIRPGLNVSLGEYGFGAENHMSGGLALAEVLGRLGQEGVHSAFHSGVPERGSAAYWAFRAFRNYDGLGSAFESESLVSTTGSSSVSLFAARSPGLTAGKNQAAVSGSLLPRLVMVVLNLDPDRPAKTQWELKGCGAVESRRLFRYSGGSQGLTELPAEFPNLALMEPYSMEVVELKLKR